MYQWYIQQTLGVYSGQFVAFIQQAWYLDINEQEEISSENVDRCLQPSVYRWKIRDAQRFRGIMWNQPADKSSLWWCIDLFTPQKNASRKGMSLVLGSTCWIPPLGSFVEGDCITRCVHWSPSQSSRPVRKLKVWGWVGFTAWNVHLHPKPSSKSHSECAPNFLTQTHLSQKFVRLAKPSRKLQSSQSLGPDPGPRGAWPCSPVATWPLNCKFVPENSENWHVANFTIC